MTGAADVTWSRSVVHELLDHIAQNLTPLLPPRLALLTAPAPAMAHFI
jgi:hypothetical protein